jgi:hypothetical protein
MIHIRHGWTNCCLRLGLTLKISTVLCDVTPCILIEVDERFGQFCCLYIRIAVTTQKMKSLCLPETSVDTILHADRHRNRSEAGNFRIPLGAHPLARGCRATAPQILRNWNLKHTDVVHIMISKILRDSPSTEFNHWNRLMTSTLEFWKIN